MDFEKFQQAFDEKMGKMFSLIEEQRKEAKELGQAKEETAAEIKKTGDRLIELKTELDSFKKQYLEEQAKQNRADQGGKEHKTIGEQFVASSEYMEWKKQGASGRSRAVTIPEGLRPHQLKTLTSDTSSAGDLINPYRKPGIVTPPLRPLTIRDLLMSEQLNEGSIEYVEETNFYDLYTEVATEGAAIDTDLVVDNAVGFYPGQTITIHLGTPIERVIDTDGVDLSTNTLSLTAALGAVVAVDVAVTSETFVYTPETYLKPRANATYDLLTESCKTLAHWMPASRQIMSDARMLQNRINTRLLQGLNLTEEQQLLYGNGTTTEIQGIMTHTSAQSYAWSDGVVGDTQLDAIRRAMTLATLAHYPVDGIILNPLDKEDIDLLKGDDEHYIWVDVVMGGRMMLWAVPVVSTTAMQEGDFLVGAFSLGATIWDREDAMIRIAEQHEDYFVRNMLAILAEKRMCLTVERPASFVVGDFDEAPAA